jgi:hypothetical protein
VEATSTAEDASLRLVFAKFADCNLNADALQHRLSKDALAKALAGADLECAEDELEDLVARFDFNSDGEINFDQFCIMVNNNSDVEKVLKSLAIEDVLAAFMPKGAANNALSAFFDMNESQVKTAVVAAVEPVTELIWAAIAKAAKTVQRQSGGGGGKMGGPLQGGTIDEFYQVKTHTFHGRTVCSNMKADGCLHRLQSMSLFTHMISTSSSLTRVTCLVSMCRVPGFVLTFYHCQQGVTGITGEPYPNLEEGVRRDHCDMPDSLLVYTSSNYGISTTAKSEYELAVGGGEGLKTIVVEHDGIPIEHVIVPNTADLESQLQTRGPLKGDQVFQ